MLTITKFKKYKLILLHVVAIFQMISPSYIQASQKYALLIGIGEYPKYSGWMGLSGDKDVDLLRQVFIQKDFLDEHIVTLTGPAATREGILKAMQDMANRINPDDVLVFHFSGHGQQIIDSNGDEADGLDEAIVPYDSPKQYIKGIYEGQYLISDDQLRGFFTEFRSKLGKNGHLLVLVDACHSGSATRGLHKSRGTDIIMGDSMDVAKLNLLQKTTTENYRELVESAEPLAPMVSLFASAPFQQSYEYANEKGELYGPLTYSFCQRLLQLPSRTTYSRLFDLISRDIATWTSHQRPVIEGNRDLYVLSNAGGRHIRFYRVLDAPAEGEIRIDGGSLHQLTEGTLLAVYGAEVEDTAGVDPIATAEIVYSDLLSADARLQHQSTASVPVHSYAVVLSQSLVRTSQKVACKCLNARTAQTIKAIVEEIPHILYDSVNPHIILEETKEGLVDMMTHDDVLIRQKIDIEKYDIQQALENVSRAHFLKHIAYEAPNFSFDLAIQDPEGHSLPKPVVLKVKQKVKISLENTGTDPFYFHLIDIDPTYKRFQMTKTSEGDHLIQCEGKLASDFLAPQFASAEDFYLIPGCRYTASFNVTEPAGRDVIKVIVSQSPIDLYLDDKTGSSRGPTANAELIENPFAKIIGQIWRGESTTRGATTSVLPANSGGIYSFYFDIKQ